MKYYSYFQNEFKRKRYNHFMIINEVTYKKLIDTYSREYFYVFLRFILSKNTISIELIVHKHKDDFLEHLNNGLSIPIYDRDISSKRKSDYISHLESIKDNKLKHIPNLSNILSTLRELYPTFTDFIENKDEVVRELSIIKESAIEAEEKIDRIRKKLNKQKYTLTQARVKILEDYKSELFQEYILDESLIEEDLVDKEVKKLQDEHELLVEKRNDLKANLSKLEKVLDVLDTQEIHEKISETRLLIFQINSKIQKTREKLVKLLGVVEYDEYTKFGKRQTSNLLKIKALNKKELEEKFLNSYYFKNNYRDKEYELMQSHIESYLLDERLNELSELFFKEGELFITNNKIFESKKQELLKISFEKCYKITKHKYEKLLQIPTNLIVNAKNIYTEFEREIYTINLYQLNHTYNMDNERIEALKNIYKLSEKFKNINFNDDMFQITMQTIRENREFYKYIMSLGIIGSDWRKVCKKRGIELPQKLDEKEEIFQEVFKEEITINGLNLFMQNSKRSHFNTKIEDTTSHIIEVEEEEDKEAVMEKEIINILSSTPMNYFIDLLISHRNFCEKLPVIAREWLNKNIIRGFYKSKSINPLALNKIDNINEDILNTLNDLISQIQQQILENQSKLEKDKPSDKKENSSEKDLEEIPF